MNEYDYDLWGLDVNNFETLPAAVALPLQAADSVPATATAAPERKAK